MCGTYVQQSVAGNLFSCLAMCRCRLWLGGKVTLGVCAFLPSSRCSSACSGPAAPQIHTHESICWLVLSTSRPCCSRGCVIRPMPSRPHQVCRGSAARPNCPCPAESPRVSVGVTLLAEAAAVTLLAWRRPVRCRGVCLCVCTCVCVHRQEAGGGESTRF